jgi:hypothetical protein
LRAGDHAPRGNAHPLALVGDRGVGRSISGALPNPVAEYVAIVVRGPVRWTHPRRPAVTTRRRRNDHATMEGLSATASTITFAAAIMVIVFGVFSFSRVLAEQFLGFGLAVAVLLDATLLRMVLVPAIMHIAGRWNWWPGVRMPQARPDA